MQTHHKSSTFSRVFMDTGTGLAAALVLCQATLAQSAAGTSANPANVGAQFAESCRQALQRDVVQPGCQEILQSNELLQLKEEALRTNNPNLLTLVGDAYRSNRNAGADLGQAYRWYLLAAVRGDPRAMQRLSVMYRLGQGVPHDNVKALGYAQLAQKLAPSGTPVEQQAASTAALLGRLMAADERDLAEQFAADLEYELHPKTIGASEKSTSSPAPKDTLPSISQIPGLSTASTNPPPSDVLPAQETQPPDRPTATPLHLPGSTEGANPSNP